VQETDFIYLDTRWSEDGWFQAMRLRLAGWLPSSEAAHAVKNGVVKYCGDDASERVQLTDRGASLTDPGRHSMSAENCTHIAEVLRFQGLIPSWLEKMKKEPDIVQGVHVAFNASYHRKLIEALEGNGGPAPSCG